MRRWIVALGLTAGLACAADAHAFVSPRWRAHQASLRSTMLGSFQVVGGRHRGVATVDVNLFVDIDEGTLRISEQGLGFSVQAKWHYVGQEGEMITISVEDEKGRRHDVDVLVESSDALTLYVQDDEGDDEEVLRLERLP